MNNINIVIACNFARIFRQNMYNCGMLAVELDAATIDGIFGEFAGLVTELSVDIKNATLTFRASGGKEKTVPFKLDGFERALVESGGWVNYAEKQY
jgi:3-isopropylmalate/(R)-2-methylmalate dehydratase small subunit